MDPLLQFFFTLSKQNNWYRKKNKMVLLLLSASVEKFSVSCMWDFLFFLNSHHLCQQIFDF